MWAEWGQKFPNTSHASPQLYVKIQPQEEVVGPVYVELNSLQRQIDFVLEASREFAPNLKPAQMVLSASGHLCQNLGDKILMDKENAQ
jgi:hypothetical protein